MSSELSQYLFFAILFLVLFPLSSNQPALNFPRCVLGALISWCLLLKLPTAITLVFTYLAFALSPLKKPAFEAIQNTYHVLRQNRELQNIENKRGAGGSELLTWHDPEATPVVDIVAVHGLASAVERTWKHPNSGKNWLKDFLPREGDDQATDEHQKRLAIFKRARVMAFSHNSAWEKNSSLKDLSDFAKQLLSTLRAERSTEQSRDRPLILIGHSFSGLLIEQALILASQPSGDEIVDKKNECIKNSLAGIIFLGTPHGGSGFSILARIYCVFHYWDGARTTLISYLDLNSEKAQDLENSFALYRQSVRTIDYYESIPDSFLGYYTKPVVTKAAAIRPGCLSVPLDANHYELNKFEKEDDPRYTEVRSKILEMVEEKLEQAGKRQEILNWLLCIEPKPPSPESFYNSHLMSLQTSICDDLIHPDAFSAWLNGEDKWLWCRGMPGAGKSFLATRIIKYILDQQKDDTRRTGIAYK